MEELKRLIRDVPDFPKPGIVFKDVTPLLADPRGFERAIAALADRAEAVRATKVVGIESRGFIFGAAVARALDVGFVPVRKPGKLPWQTVRESYALEYGTDAIEIHKDAVAPRERVVIVDDLLATGGTLEACARLVRTLGGDVAACLVVIELEFLKGRDRLVPHEVHSLIRY